MTTTDPAGTLEEARHAMDAEPGSGIETCHGPRKTTVDLSDDGKYIVENDASSTIRRLHLDALPGDSS